MYIRCVIDRKLANLRQVFVADRLGHGDIAEIRIGHLAMYALELAVEEPLPLRLDQGQRRVLAMG